MNTNSTDLLNNFADELKRRMSLVTEEGEFESKNVDMETFIMSPDYMNLSQDISEANLQLLIHVDNPAIREAWLILEAARIKNKWVHIGRVNTRGRIVYFYDIAHSIDGTGLSKYTHMYKEAIRAIDNLYGTYQEKII